MRRLALYDDYSRADVHGIFSPDTVFHPQAGVWGLQGVIPIPDRPGDYVFLVTFGQSQGEHVFDEGITEEGVLSWQSQPRQTLNDKRIQQWIHHNEFHNSIYLFLRTSKGRNYTYFGRLKYLSHDLDRESPVYFQWQIIEWSMPTEKQLAIGLKTQTSFRTEAELIPANGPAVVVAGLIEVTAPEKTKGFGRRTPQFRTQKRADYSLRDELDRKLGEAGELAVLQNEKRRLVLAGRSDLAEKIIHVSQTEGDGAGYDIKSYNENGTVKYIEVKATRGGKLSPFFMSINEILFSKIHADNYALHRVFDFDIGTQSGKVFELMGDIEHAAHLEGVNFRVKV